MDNDGFDKDSEMIPKRFAEKVRGHPKRLHVL
jgi:hypothetical protein